MTEDLAAENAQLKAELAAGLGLPASRPAFVPTHRIPSEHPPHLAARTAPFAEKVLFA